MKRELLAAVAAAALLLAGCSSSEPDKPAGPPKVDWSKVSEAQHRSIDDAVEAKDCDLMQTYFDGSEQADVLEYLDWQMKKAGCYGAS